MSESCPKKSVTDRKALVKQACFNIRIQNEFPKEEEFTSH
jgi:hypothetical protein